MITSLVLLYIARTLKFVMLCLEKFFLFYRLQQKAFYCDSSRAVMFNVPGKRRNALPCYVFSKKHQPAVKIIYILYTGKEVIILPSKDELQHDLLLVIATVIAVFFATGIAGPSSTPGTPVVFP